MAFIQRNHLLESMADDHLSDICGSLATVFKKLDDLNIEGHTSGERDAFRDILHKEAKKVSATISRIENILHSPKQVTASLNIQDFLRKNIEGIPCTSEESLVVENHPVWMVEEALEQLRKIIVGLIPSLQVASNNKNLTLNLSNVWLVDGYTRTDGRVAEGNYAKITLVSPAPLGDLLGLQQDLKSLLNDYTGNPEIETISAFTKCAIGYVSICNDNTEGSSVSFFFPLDFPPLARLQGSITA